MWVLLMIGAPITIATLFMKETSKEQILLARSKARGDQHIHRPPHRATTSILGEKVKIACTRPVKMLLTEPMVGYLSLYTGFSFAMVFSFLTSVPYVFESVYDFENKNVSLVFIGIMIGCALGVVSFAVFDRTLYRKARARGGGRCAPEHRLYAAMLGSILLPVGLFW